MNKKMLLFVAFAGLFTLSSSQAMNKKANNKKTVKQEQINKKPTIEVKNENNQPPVNNNPVNNNNQVPANNNNQVQSPELAQSLFSLVREQPTAFFALTTFIMNMLTEKSWIKTFFSTTIGTLLAYFFFAYVQQNQYNNVPSLKDMYNKTCEKTNEWINDVKGWFSEEAPAK